jgi:hypothetical protein
MSYSTNRDWTTSALEFTKTPWPLPPLNLFMTSGYAPGIYDLRWDDPSTLGLNSKYRLLGVNLYRSFDSEFGPFNRISEMLVCTTFWRDHTDNELLIDEDVSDRFILDGECSASGASAPRWVFKTLHSPIVKEASQAVVTDSPDDVVVKIDGVLVRPLAVHGFSGEVEIDPFIYANVTNQKLDPALVPGKGSEVTCTYRRNRTLLRTDLGQRVFYRVTTVGVKVDCDLSKVQCQDLVETPLEHAAATSSMEIEKIDYIWREAVRRNRFILEQGGERVKVFIRKQLGVPCTCIADDYHKQPQNDCPRCYGTGILGGYEGPYDILIAPDDAERRIAQKDMGRNLEHVYEVWTGPAPILSQRDFLIKINGERYSVGPVRFPTNRGMVLQQHFNIGHIDELDIRYKVPVGNPTRFSFVQFTPNGPESEAMADITDKQGIPNERELRGRTKAWENTSYGILLMLLPWHELWHHLYGLIM